MFGGKKKKLLAEGTQAQAVVLGVSDTGVTINENPRVKLTLQVQPEGGAPFEATKTVTVSRVAIPRAGDSFIVRYDPADPSRVEIDGAAAAAANAAAQAQVAQGAANQLPPDLAATGIPGRGALVDVQTTPMGQLVSCTITAGVRLVDGTPAYRASAQLSVAPETVSQLVPGQTLFTVRADPNNRSRIAISLSEPTPSVLITDPAVVDVPARALREGTPCQVQLVTWAEQFLHLSTGESLVAAKLRVLEDGTELQAYVPVPPAARAQLIEGAVLPAKRLPLEPQVITVDWQAVPVAV
jgi:hypothetical protein